MPVPVRYESNLLDDPLATSMFGPLTTKLVVDWHCFFIDADPDPDPTRSLTHVGKSDKKTFCIFLSASYCVIIFPILGDIHFEKII
jgi:hypothetical protein